LIPSLQEEIDTFHKDGYSNAEIAKILGLSESDIRAGLRHLKEHPIKETDMMPVKRSKVGEKATFVKDEYTPHYYIDNASKWRWTLVGSNGKIYGASHQGFATKYAAQRNYGINRK
jgi:transposase